MTIYYVQYHIRPLPQSEDYASAGGAYANCFVQAESAQHAAQRAQAYIDEIQWEVVELEDGPAEVTRDEFTDAEPEWLEAFDGAVADGEHYALYIWPNEAQDDDVVH